MRKTTFHLIKEARVEDKFEEGVLRADALTDRYDNAECMKYVHTGSFAERVENRFLSALFEYGAKVGRKVTPDEAEAIKSVIEAKE